jgi:hypothetical protein
MFTLTRDNIWKISVTPIQSFIFLLFVITFRSLLYPLIPASVTHRHSWKGHLSLCLSTVPRIRRHFSAQTVDDWSALRYGRFTLGERSHSTEWAQEPAWTLQYLYISYPCNRPWRPVGLWDVEAPTFSRQSAHRWRSGCQPYAPAAHHPQEYFWYSFLLEAELIPGP